MEAHPEVAREQEYLDFAHECLAGMRERTARAAARTSSAATEVDSELLRARLRQRLRSLEETGGALCFGRIDYGIGDRFYIGRRHVEDGDGEPVVVDWRTHVAVPFYRATVSDPMELHLRRRFGLAGREILDILDEVLDDPDADWSGIHGGVPDPLLAELERSRTGEMRDIVATIQAEQDRIIRAPLDRTVVVQGGPGTGKTAVGLHRAAFLLYEHRHALEDDGVLVIGPNRIFLRYISQVLPSLGESAVRQSTIEGLMASRFPVRRAEDEAAARVKGDARMAAVVRRLCVERIRPPEDDLSVRVGLDRIRLPAADVRALVEELLSRGSALNVAREVFRRRIERMVHERHAERRHVPLPDEVVLADVRSDRDFQRSVDRIWPSLSPAAVVRQLVGSPAALERAARGVLDDGEQDLIRRPVARKIGEETWTASDIPLVDEAAALVAGPPPAYGHVVVDEAQDLSAMALRMVARRARAASLTVLGDLAQATSPAAQTDWGAVVAHLGQPPGASVEELEIGYRLPAAILDYANRLLPVAAPHVRPSRSVRPGGQPPEERRVAAADMGGAVAGAVGELAAAWATVGVIVPASWLAEAAASLKEAGVRFGEGLRVGLDERVTLLPPRTAKGLEFDAVVVAEPARIVAEEPHGARALYVALTRAVQQVVLVHADPLPAALHSHPHRTLSR